MANKERNKRSARKARAQAREVKEAARAASQAQAAPDQDAQKKPLFSRGDKAEATKAGTSKAAAKDAKPQDKAAKKDLAKKNKKPGVFARIGNYFHDVRVEMGRVIWPSRQELWSYTYAVIIMLVVAGVVLWAVDTGIVSLMLAYTGLRG